MPSFALTVVQGSGRGRTFRFDRAVSIGRDCANDLVLNDSAVSRVHAIIECRRAGWALVDRGSANGTTLNGRSISGAEELRDGDCICVGTVLFEFRGPRWIARLESRWRALRAPARAVLVAAGVLVFGIGLECAAHVRSEPPRVDSGTSRLDQAVHGDAAAPAPAVVDVERARTTLERGRRKLLERRIAPRNLFDAWTALREARDAYGTLVPRPSVWPELTQSIAECDRDLRRECQRLLFIAARFERYGDTDKAQQAWREMLLHFPGEDPGGCRRKAQENVVSTQPDVAPE